MIVAKDLSELRKSDWAKELAQLHPPHEVEDILYAVATKPVLVEISRDLMDGVYKWSVEPSVFDTEGLPLALYLVRDTLEACQAFCSLMNWTVDEVADHTVTLEDRISAEKRAVNYWMTKLRIASDTSQVPSLFHGSGKLSEDDRKRVLEFLREPSDANWSLMARVTLIAGQVSATDVMIGSKDRPVFHGKPSVLSETPTPETFIAKLKEARSDYIEMCKREIERHQRTHDWLYRSGTKKRSRSNEARNAEPQVIRFPTKEDQEN